MVMTPSMVSSLISSALIASATAVASPKRSSRQRQLRALAAGGGDAVDHALAARFGVGRTRQGVDAEDVLLAMRCRNIRRLPAPATYSSEPT